MALCKIAPRKAQLCSLQGTIVLQAGNFIASVVRKIASAFINNRMHKIPFTLHLFALNADKHWGFERERSNLTLHHPSSCVISKKVQPNSGLFPQFMDFLQRKFGGC